MLLALTAAGLLSQAGGWNLIRGINPGQTTHVHMLDGRLQSGGFISTTDDNIVIRQRTGDQTFTKEQIRKVSVRKAAKRWRNAAIGAAAGTAIGGALNRSLYLDLTGVATVVIFGGTGACIGALFPGYDTLYRAPRK